MHNSPSNRRRWLRIATLVLLFVATAAAWKWTPLSQWLEAERLRTLLQSIRDDPWAPLWVVAGYAIGGLLFMPVLPALLATALVFDPGTAIAASLVGLVLSGTACYGVGRLLGGDAIISLSHGRVAWFRQKLIKNGVVPVILLRNFPVVPFSVASMAAGAFGLQFRGYILGTALGMVPPVVIATLLQDRFRALLVAPPEQRLQVLASLVVVIIVAIVIIRWIRRRVFRKLDDTPGNPS